MKLSLVPLTTLGLSLVVMAAPTPMEMVKQGLLSRREVTVADFCISEAAATHANKNPNQYQGYYLGNNKLQDFREKFPCSAEEERAFQEGKLQRIVKDRKDERKENTPRRAGQPNNPRNTNVRGVDSRRQLTPTELEAQRQRELRENWKWAQPPQSQPQQQPQSEEKEQTPATTGNRQTLTVQQQRGQQEFRRLMKLRIEEQLRQQQQNQQTEGEAMGGREWPDGR